MAAPIQKVSCPICGRSFDISAINQHIDSCLSTPEDCRGEVASETVDRDDCQPMSKRKRTDDSEKLSNKKDDGPVKLSMFAKSFSTTAKNIPTSSQNAVVAKSGQSNGSSFFTKRSKSSGAIPKVLTEGPLDGNFSGHSSTSTQSKNIMKSKDKPLAEQMRPDSLESYIGQSNVVGKNKLLYSLLTTGEYLSLILWGPPGCGKTTLAKIIANRAKMDGYRFVTMSATTSGVADIKEVTKTAKNELKMFKRRTMLFVDEIHHFNKTQQDTFLPCVEDGTLILIGATTENPSFQLNNALLSRCRVVVLEKLSPESVRQILERALKRLDVTVVTDDDVTKVADDVTKSDDDVIKSDGDDEETGANKNGSEAKANGPRITSSALDQLSLLCDGDARASLTCLEMALRASSSTGAGTVTARHVLEAMQRRHVQYDRAGEEHYNCASALQKSIRGGSDQGALYWVARMMEGGEDPLYIARRLVRTASEDIGLADPMALTHAMAAFQACHALGKKESDVILAQTAVYLARAPKSHEVYSAYTNAVSSIRRHQGPLPAVPLHLRNASTKLMKDLGYGAGYRYEAKPGEQQYLPAGMEDVNFFSIPPSWK